MNCRRTARVVMERGYTIVEVIVVMTVTGVLFVTVAMMMSGRQGENETAQAARSFEARVQSTVSDVASGDFPSGITCTPTTTGISITGGSHPAGSNKGCIFLGKIINLHNKDLDVITILGRQYAVGTETVDVKNLSEAVPAVVNFSNRINTYSYSYEAKILQAVSITNPTVGYRAIGFLHELGGGITALNTSSGSRGVELYGIEGSAATNNTAPGSILGVSPLVKINGGVSLCFESGNGVKFEVTVGADGDQTNTNVLINKGVSSVCESA